MAVVIEDQAVRDIYECEEDLELSGFITAAAMLIDAKCGAYSDSEQQTLGAWLAAHFASCDRSRLAVEVIGRSREEIVTKSDLRLDLTHHGQQVKVLDYLGLLAGIGENRKVIKVTWLGCRRWGWGRYW